MSLADRRRWDEKYSEREFPETLKPDRWLVELAGDLQPGRALEPACGVGHNSIWLAQQGWTVDAVDISPVGLNQAKQLAQQYSRNVNWIAADLDAFTPPEEQYDLVLVFRFLDRLRLPGVIQRALKPGGILLYETFTTAQLDRPDNHLKSRLFVLETNELPRLFPGLKQCGYDEIELAERTVARFMGQKPC